MFPFVGRTDPPTAHYLNLLILQANKDSYSQRLPCANCPATSAYDVLHQASQLQQYKTSLTLDLATLEATSSKQLGPHFLIKLLSFLAIQDPQSKTVFQPKSSDVKLVAPAGIVCRWVSKRQDDDGNTPMKSCSLFIVFAIVIREGSIHE
ncbi:hypothetical protein PGT21_009466 [Puccinia graminis f. sp. tritici]|uniref:Uncharacterized protein n=1 Tax=Puccinia graminis f. sp. tritici TaxID=56615 RepID=A0A5B0MD07_PUCGR|nr:hypothetical protein PGT21_009466 [Puccinia graminis f. sp. tritici]